ncbi:hypothetical protein ACFXDH_42900 [Streptomyces sp. NPDC059467]|uniref:hypothetical protein n=1 Tax=Streptomyces sp. NPDC059467 TaxID=3346844 RepID=UPI0036BC7805
MDAVESHVRAFFAGHSVEAVDHDLGPGRREAVPALPDLFAVADEPYSEELRPVLHCHHLGRVFAAAVPLSTAQLVEAAEEADRLSVREDHGVWRPVSQGFAEECPDFP